jgi:hypothetical protein
MLVRNSPLIRLTVVVREVVRGLVWLHCMIHSDVRVHSSRESEEIQAKVDFDSSVTGT